MDRIEEHERCRQRGTLILIADGHVQQLTGVRNEEAARPGREKIEAAADRCVERFRPRRVGLTIGDFLPHHIEN